MGARAVKAVLPDNVKLMASGWTWQTRQDQLGPKNSFLRFAAASDGAGGTGRDHVQAISIHLYTHHFDPNSRIPELRRYASLIARAAGDGAAPDTVFKELSVHTIPNAHILSAGVVAVTRAQEYGYSLIHVG